MGSTSQQGLSVAQQVQQDYAQLASSLQSGDLAGAQSAFANLQQALQSQGTSTPQSTTESGTSSSSGSDTIANDFSALGQALSSGNLSQAQSAFSQLQTDIQSTQQAEASQSQSFIQQMLTLLQEQQSSTSTTGSTNGSTTGNNNSTVNIYA